MNRREAVASAAALMTGAAFLTRGEQKRRLFTHKTLRGLEPIEFEQIAAGDVIVITDWDGSVITQQCAVIVERCEPEKLFSWPITLDEVWNPRKREDIHDQATTVAGSSSAADSIS